MKHSKLEEGEYISESFEGLNVSGCDLSAKVFDGCVFKNCDFSEAILNKCKFIDCHFLRCNLSLVKIKDATFSDVYIEECKVVGVDWTVVSWSEYVLVSPLKFHKCVINDSSFFGLSLEDIEIQDCKAHDVDFREGNFSGADFSYTDFTNSLFNKTNLSDTDFTEATNYDVDINFNEVSRAKFSRFEAVRLLESLDIELVD